MPDTASITIVKTFDYRGAEEKWSNTYHFSGTTPATTADWKTLGEAIWAAESPLFKPGGTRPIRLAGIYGYNAGDNNSVAQIDYLVPPLSPLPATGDYSGMSPQSGDVAFWVRWRTPDRNSRGKYIYLRKYFHGALTGGGTQDTLPTAQKTAADALGAKMISGTLPGGVKICGPQGAVASAPLTSPFYTTRTLKRRGKRPSR